MIDLSSPYAVTNYNSVHKRLGGIMLARYWTIIISVLLFIIIAIIGAVSAQSTITSGQSSFMAGDYEKGASAIDSLFSMGETLGYVFLALGIVLSITLLILFIMFIVRLYAYRSFLRGTGAAKGATALIIALWLNIGFSILLGVLLAIALRSYGESNDNLTIIPMVGFVVALVVEIAGYAMLKSSDDLYSDNRSGFSKLLVADCFYLVAIIISAITLLVGGDSDAMTILPIISGIVALVSLIIAMVGWGRVRRPVFDPGAYAAVPAAQPVAPKPAAAPRPAPAPRPAVAPAAKPVAPAAKPVAPAPKPAAAAAARPAPAAPKPAAAPAAKPAAPAAKPVAPAPKPAAAPAAPAAKPAAPAVKPAAPAPAAPKPAAARPKFCFNCGSPLPDHGNFCPRCGTKIA